MDERSPYAPPVSDVLVIEERKGAWWKALLYGVLIDIGGTMLLGIVVATVTFSVLTAQGKDTSDLLGDPVMLMIGKVLWTEFFNNRDWPVASAVAIALLLFLVLPIKYLDRAQNKANEDGGHN